MVVYRAGEREKGGKGHVYISRHEPFRRRADPRHRRFAGAVCPAPAPAAAVRALWAAGACAPAVARLSPVAVEPVPGRGERGRGGAPRRRRRAHRRATDSCLDRRARRAGRRARGTVPAAPRAAAAPQTAPAPQVVAPAKRRKPRAARLAHRPRFGGGCCCSSSSCRPLRARPAPLSRLRALRGRFRPPVARPPPPAPAAAPAPLRRHRRAADLRPLCAPSSSCPRASTSPTARRSIACCATIWPTCAASTRSSRRRWPSPPACTGSIRSSG